MEFKFRFDLSGSNSGFEIVFVEITNCSKNIIVGCVYRAPSYDSVSFVENLEHQLQILSRENKEICLMGDFNIKLMNYDTDHNVKDFLDFMYSFGLFSLVTKPTRITEINATLIDTIFTNCIHINELLGRSNRHSLPQEMDCNGVLLSSAKDKAESFNKYFIGLPMKISADIPQVPQSFQDYMKQFDDNASMFLKPTSKSEIIDIVSSLKRSKSSGSDDISPRIIWGAFTFLLIPYVKS